MKILNGYLNLKKGTVLTIGNFDGIHKGHQKILKKNVEISKKYNLNSAVITFDPHPNEFFKKNKSPFKLTNKNTKIKEIKKMGINYLIFIKFTKDFTKLSPEKFIKKIIDLNPQFIVVGYNFRFGYKRKGNVNLLQKFSEKYSYKLEVISRVLNKNKKVINSTLIRKKIKTGHYNNVKDMLGRYWLLEG